VGGRSDRGGEQDDLLVLPRRLAFPQEVADDRVAHALAQATVATDLLGGPTACGIRAALQQRVQEAADFAIVGIAAVGGAQDGDGVPSCGSSESPKWRLARSGFGNRRHEVARPGLVVAEAVEQNPAGAGCVSREPLSRGVVVDAAMLDPQMVAIVDPSTRASRRRDAGRAHAAR
jgi:hypothetical protein